MKYSEKELNGYIEKIKNKVLKIPGVVGIGLVQNPFSNELLINIFIREGNWHLIEKIKKFMAENEIPYDAYDVALSKNIEIFN
jgi:hypothetical protein